MTIVGDLARTHLDRLLSGPESLHPGQSGFRLVQAGAEAFLTRLASARHAGRTLDVQTYIWRGDTTGLYLVREILRAADRGVRVRLLVDDLDARAKNAGFAALAAHPRIEVRMFNPLDSRRGVAAFAGEALRDFGRINHRMHNKSWIADDRFALAGGRNLGDEYFGASDGVNFIDLDFAMVGPVVRDATASFARYWNCDAARPMQALDGDNVTALALDALRASLDAKIDESRVDDYRRLLHEDDALPRLVSGGTALHWTRHYRFVADDPGKATMAERDPGRSLVLAAVLPVLRNARTQLALVSPYFVPGKAGVRLLAETAATGARVRVLTNSLAATDVAAVHGGYSRSRPALLANGVHLWEFKPAPGPAARGGRFGSSGASLHTKAMVADGRVVFVGSYNLDPRSTWLNCEQGVLVEDPAIAAELEELFCQQTGNAHAWRVTRGKGGLRWSDGTQAFGTDPKAPLRKRWRAWLARVFRLDAQL